jgi:hypothetical protein
MARFTKDELELILTEPDLNYIDYRNYTIINLILFLDFNSIEICRSVESDLNIAKRKFKDQHLNKNLTGILDKYNKLRFDMAYNYASLITYEMSELLFFTRNCKPLLINSISSITRTHIKRIGVEPPYYHRFFETAKYIRANNIKNLRHYK